MNFQINKELRAVPQNKEEFYLLIAKLQSSLPQSTGLDRVNILGELAVYLRIDGQLEKAEKLLREALVLIKEHDLGIGKAIQQKIRLGHVLQFKKDFKASNALFQEIFATIEKNNSLAHYEAFAWQHWGKNLFDQERYDEALIAFEKTLEIRTRKDAPKDQLQSTKIAIKRTKELMAATRKAGLLGGALGINAIDGTKVKQDGLVQLPTMKPQ
mgnify:CR=1 FL=1